MLEKQNYAHFMELSILTTMIPIYQGNEANFSFTTEAYLLDMPYSHCRLGKE